MNPTFRINRRHFLRGAAGAMLALPLMPSLLPRKLEAQAIAPRKRFIMFDTQHGGIYPEIMFPAAATLTEKKALGYIPGHQIGRGALVPKTESGKTGVSPQLTASSSVLSEELIKKMNVIKGLDIPFYIGHHSGGFLGNFGRSDDPTAAATVARRPTIDQLMAHSPSFYSEGELGGVKAPTVHIGIGGGKSVSWDYVNPSDPSQGVQYVDTINQAFRLFQTVYSPPPDTSVKPRTPAVDLVLENYKRLRDGGKLSADDRDRLSAHMDRIGELQRKLVVVSSCTDVTQPSQDVDINHLYGSIDPARMIEYHQVMSDVLLTAVICGTRIGTVSVGDNFSNYAGDWHEEIAHRAYGDPAKEQMQVDANLLFFEQVFMRFVNNLNVAEGDGTILDSSLVMWVQESGLITHDSFSLPVVTFGSMGGYLKTGNYVDYTNYANKHSTGAGKLMSQRFPGILYAQWLGTILQAAGLSPSEYQRDGETGYGEPHRDDYFGGGGPQTWPDALFKRGSEVVPFLKA